MMLKNANGNSVLTAWTFMFNTMKYANTNNKLCSVKGKSGNVFGIAMQLDPFPFCLGIFSLNPKVHFTVSVCLFTVMSYLIMHILLFYACIHFRVSKNKVVPRSVHVSCYLLLGVT